MLSSVELNTKLPYLFEGEIEYIQKLGGMLPNGASVVMLGIGPGVMALALLEGTKYPIEFVGIDNENFTGVEHLKAAGFDGRMKAIKANSHTAHTIYQNESIDLLLVDACHQQHCVEQDIKGWWPKVKYGGVVLFHDYIPLEADNGVDRAIDRCITPEWDYLAQPGISVVFKKVRR